MTRLYNRETELDKRRQLRSRMPKAEVLLWVRLKGRQMCDAKFRRQYSIGPYILDFYCPIHRLAVELDGDTHSAAGAPAYDANRQTCIERLGIRVLRFTNREVYENLDAVLATIAVALGATDI